MDDIWIPFFDDNENLQNNSNVKNPEYKEIKNLNDYIETYGDIKEKLINILKHLIPKAFTNYKNIIKSLCNINYVKNIDSKLSIYLNNDYSKINDSQRLYDLSQYIKNNCVDEINQIIKTMPVQKISFPTDVVNLYDTVGSTTQLAKDFDVDVKNRSFCFLYINGELLQSSFGGMHFQLINKYLSEHKIKHDSYVSSGRFRDVQDIKKYHDINLDNDIPIAWGHFAHGIAYIETCKNVTLSTVVNKLLQEIKGIKKIYQYHFNEQSITRLAKKSF